MLSYKEAKKKYTKNEIESLGRANQFLVILLDLVFFQIDQILTNFT